MPTSYVFDPTGLAAANKIVGEVHTLTEINANPYKLFIPEFAPFYLDNFKLYHVDNLGTQTLLTEGVDFHLTLPYIAATRSIGKMLYGGVSISNLQLQGTYKITYQTIGGEWVSDVSNVLANIVNNNYNPRIVAWDIITNVQAIFPPINHEVHMDQLKGHEDLINGLSDLASTIANKPQPMYPLPASQAQVNTGLDNKTYVTPLTLKNAVGIGGSGSGGVPAPHTHAIDDITSLQSTLNTKSDTNHVHSIAGITNLQSSLDGKASAIHSHGSTDITGLDTLLSAKASASHTHTKADIGLGNVDNTSDANKPISSAVQSAITTMQNQINALVTAIANKADINHTHTSAQITDLGSLSSGLGLNIITTMTGQYPFGTDIVNENGDMLISVHGGLNTNNSINLYVDGKLVSGIGNATGAYISSACFGFVPAGKTFKIDLVSGAGAPNITVWTKYSIGSISNTINETFSGTSIVGWTTGQSLLGGSGATVGVSGGYLVPTSFGSGTDWHGPRVTKYFPDVSDFDITFEDVNFSNVASDICGLYLTIGSNTDKNKFYFNMNDAWDNSTAGLEGFSFGGKNTLNEGAASGNNSLEVLSAANIRMTRTGSVFKGYVNGVEKYSLACTTDTVSQIAIEFVGYKTFAANAQSVGGVSGSLTFI